MKFADLKFTVTARSQPNKTHTHAQRNEVTLVWGSLRLATTTNKLSTFTSCLGSECSLWLADSEIIGPIDWPLNGVHWEGRGVIRRSRSQLLGGVPPSLLNRQAAMCMPNPATCKGGQHQGFIPHPAEPTFNKAPGMRKKLLRNDSNSPQVWFPTFFSASQVHATCLQLRGGGSMQKVGEGGGGGGHCWREYRGAKRRSIRAECGNFFRLRFSASWIGSRSTYSYIMCFALHCLLVSSLAPDNPRIQQRHLPLAMRRAPSHHH